jgi:integrase
MTSSTKKGPKPTGQLIERATGWFARVRVIEDGVWIRRSVNLETSDRFVARRKLARLLSAPDKSPEKVAAPPLTFRELALEAHARWKARTWADGRAPGLRTAGGRLRWLEIHAFPIVGHVAVNSFTVAHALDVLEAAAAKGLARQSLIHLKNAMASVFDPLVDRQVLTVNPAKIARLRAVEGVHIAPKKDRAVLTDDELGAYLAYVPPVPDKAVRQRQTMAILSRCFGGVRTGDIHAMRWEHFDLDGFTWGDALRLKTSRPQRLEIPEALRPFLRAWWEEHNRPTQGVVFPALRGKRAGEEKHGVYHAVALRRDLYRAGVRRHECTRTEPLPHRDAPCCPGVEGDPLYRETATTLPVDFHSFRRAYATALAATGVNLQTAMRLAGHASSKTHDGYVKLATKPLAAPPAAMPRIRAAVLGSAPRIGVDRGDAKPPPHPVFASKARVDPAGGRLLSRGSGVRVPSGVPEIREPRAVLGSGAARWLVALAELAALMTERPDVAASFLAHVSR